MNIMLDYVKVGKIQNAVDLKKLYRSLILKTHPDISKNDNSTAEFIKIQNQYKEAQAYIDNGLLADNQPKNFQITDILNIFFELVALGYPSGNIKHKNYSKRLSKLSTLYDLNLPKGNANFDSIQRDISQLKGNSINPGIEFNTVRNYLYLLQSYYHNSFKYIRPTLENEQLIITRILTNQNLHSLCQFLKFLHNNVVK